MAQKPPQQDPPKIEFPCDYPISVMGASSDVFTDEVFAIVKQFAPEIDRAAVVTRDSSKSRFRSVRITIRATGRDH